MNICNKRPVVLQAHVCRLANASFTQVNTHLFAALMYPFGVQNS